MPRVIDKTTEAAIDVAERSLLSHHEMVIPREKLREIIESDPVIVRCLRHYPADATDFDTYDRGYLLWGVANSIGYEDWPGLGMCNADQAEFLKCLCDAGYVPGLTREMLDKRV